VYGGVCADHVGVGEQMVVSDPSDSFGVSPELRDHMA
jgi:hypothetical protein